MPRLSGPRWKRASHPTAATRRSEKVCRVEQVSGFKMGVMIDVVIKYTGRGAVSNQE